MDGQPLEGKAALVTGGSRGIGAAIARRLAADGADIAVTYLHAADRAQSVVDDVRTRGRRGIAIGVDVTDAAQAREMVARTVAELGRIDVLVNNAGVFASGPFEDVDVATIDLALAVHARAAYVGAQAAVDHMGRDGRIINVGTCFVDRVPRAGLTLYAMSKAALVGLTKGLARDLAGRGIAVSLVNPGPTDTDMNPAAGPRAATSHAPGALGRHLDADEVAATVAHLAGPAGEALTGASIAVDGGFTA